jgi:hypothetical protein
MMSASQVYSVPGIGRDAERPNVEIDGGDDVVDDLRTHMFGLLEHLLHQPGSLDGIGEAGIVFDVGGDGQLAALLQPGDEDRVEHGARGIDRRRITGRPRADDEDRSVGCGHGNSLSVWRARRLQMRIFNAMPLI